MKKFSCSSVILASVALASSVLAQENTPTSIPKMAPDSPELSGLISPLGGRFYPGAFVKEEDRGTPGIKILAQGQMPEGTQFVGDISGPFANAQTGLIEIGKVTLNDASDKCLVKGATYHAELVLVSKQGVYGVALQHPDQKQAALSVALSAPAKLIHISSDIEAASLWGQRGEWTVATIAPKLLPAKEAKKQSVQNQVRFRASMTGYFLNFNRNDGDSKREEVMTLDALALGMHGLLATNYALSTHFTDLRTNAKMCSVALGGSPNENLMRVDVDIPQREMSVRVLIEGTKFTKTGLGFGTSDTPLQLGQGA